MERSEEVEMLALPWVGGQLKEWMGDSQGLTDAAGVALPKDRTQPAWKPELEQTRGSHERQCSEGMNGRQDRRSSVRPGPWAYKECPGCERDWTQPAWKPELEQTRGSYERRRGEGRKERQGRCSSVRPGLWAYKECQEHEGKTWQMM
jgi:hypothetical protein